MKSYMTYHIWERYPKFKSRHDSHKAYTTNFTNGNITVDFIQRQCKTAQKFQRTDKVCNGITGSEWKILCITSDGKKYENPKMIKNYEKKLVELQSQLAHKEKRSQNYYKTKKKIALCHEK